MGPAGPGLLAIPGAPAHRGPGPRGTRRQPHRNACSPATRAATGCTRRLHRAGFASQSQSVSRGRRSAPHDVWLTAAARCAPPGNRPAPPTNWRAAAPSSSGDRPADPRARRARAGRRGPRGLVAGLRQVGGLRREPRSASRGPVSLTGPRPRCGWPILMAPTIRAARTRTRAASRGRCGTRSSSGSAASSTSEAAAAPSSTSARFLLTRVVGRAVSAGSLPVAAARG